MIASKRPRDNYEIAYLAHEDGRGRGLVTRAVSLLCDALFDAGIGRLELRTHLLAGRGLARTLAVGDPVSLSVRPECVHWIPVRRADAAGARR